MKQSLPCEANSHSAGDKIVCFYETPRFLVVLSHETTIDPSPHPIQSSKHAYHFGRCPLFWLFLFSNTVFWKLDIFPWSGLKEEVCCPYICCLIMVSLASYTLKWPTAANHCRLFFPPSITAQLSELRVAFSNGPNWKLSTLAIDGANGFTNRWLENLEYG
jgi:hypothetical protein